MWGLATGGGWGYAARMTVVGDGAVLADPPPEGTIVAGKYRVGERLGAGGMGTLVQAEHLLLHKQVAIKFMRRCSASSHRRFIREAQAAQSLSSDHVVRVFDIGFHDDVPFIVMEHLDGSDLATLTDGGPLPVEEAVDCLLEACVGVAEAHALGIVHRDLKPANLFYAHTAAQQRSVKVLDFGISKLATVADEPVPAAETHTGTSATATGALLGSPHFMSPEQLRDPSSVDVRTDVWALGVTGYVLLTGEQPFAGDSVADVTRAVFAADPPPASLRGRGIPSELDLVLEAALAKRLEDRIPSVAELARRLAPFSGKRGRLAAERAEAFESPVARGATGPKRPVPDAAAATETDAGLSTTVGTSTRRIAWRRGVLPAVAGLIAVASAILWARAGEVARLGHGLARFTPPARVPPSAAARIPVEALPAPSAPGAPSPSRADAPRQRHHPVRPHAVASAAPPPLPPPPRLDADGVPIIR